MGELMTVPEYLEAKEQVRVFEKTNRRKLSLWRSAERIKSDVQSHLRGATLFQDQAEEIIQTVMNCNRMSDEDKPYLTMEDS